MKNPGIFRLCIFILLLLNLNTIATASSLKQCSTLDLSFTLDDKDGYFNGMSHSGVLLVLHNNGTKACSVPARPILGFENAQHQPLPISMQTPKGMYPGPVIPPIVIPAGAWVTSEMRWVSGEVYDNSHCLSPAFITMALEQEILRTKFDGHLCGPAGKNPVYTLTFFKHDPTYTP